MGRLETSSGFFFIKSIMSTKRSPSEIPLGLGVRTVGDAIRELSMTDSEDGQTEKANPQCNWNENSSKSSDQFDDVSEALRGGSNEAPKADSSQPAEDGTNAENKSSRE